MPDYQAHKRAALLYTSANEIALRKDLEKCKARLVQAEKHVDMFCEVTDNIVKHAFEVPDDQMLPFVHQTVLEIEHARKYVK